MKLTFVNFGSDRCGGVRVLFEVVNGLIARGHTVDYLALADQNWFPLKTKIRVCKSPQEMPETIGESDVVVATWCQTAYIVDAVKGRKGIPAYYAQHFEPIFFFRPQDQQAVKATYDLPLNLIANSPWLQERLKSECKRESCLVVPGVDSKVFCPDGAAVKLKAEAEDSRQKAFAKFKMDMAAFEAKPGVNVPTLGACVPFKVLAFASGTPFKGLYDTVLPAFNYLHRRLGSAVEFHLYGGHRLQAETPFPVTIHQGLSDVDLAKLYNSCDLFVSGSWAESSPLPHLEAMACGLPVVCTAPGTEHYGSGLLRVPPRAPRQLGEAVYQVLFDAELRGKMGQANLEAAKGFTWERTVDGAEAFFKGLTGEA